VCMGALGLTGLFLEIRRGRRREHTSNPGGPTSQPAVVN
jgi:hypothetical protein